MYRDSFRLACVAFGILGITAAAVAAPRDRKAPTRPTDMHVTAISAWSVSLAWSPSTDNSGQLTHYVYSSNGQMVTVPLSTTSVAFTSGFQHRGTYDFFVFAIDAGRKQVL